MSIVIHHNPACGTSRNVLAIIRASGEVPEIIDYLETGWTRPQLLALFATAGLTPRTALRTTKSPAEELGLLDPSVDDETLLAAMLEHPVLVNRPIVCTPRGVRLCRPSETVLELLERLPPGPLAKEDGTLLIDQDGRRVGES
ncbi:MAG: arsenate reductase (glutaredoxin) [Jhaorihella sp.]